MVCPYPHYVHKKMEAERIYVICLNLYIKCLSAMGVNLDLPEQEPMTCLRPFYFC